MDTLAIVLLVTAISDQPCVLSAVSEQSCSAHCELSVMADGEVVLERNSFVWDQLTANRNSGNAAADGQYQISNKKFLQSVLCALFIASTPCLFWIRTTR